MHEHHHGCVVHVILWPEYGGVLARYMKEDMSRVKHVFTSVVIHWKKVPLCNLLWNASKRVSQVNKSFCVLHSKYWFQTGCILDFFSFKKKKGWHYKESEYFIVLVPQTEVCLCHWSFIFILSIEGLKLYHIYFIAGSCWKINLSLPPLFFFLFFSPQCMTWWIIRGTNKW